MNLLLHKAGSHCLTRYQVVYLMFHGCCSWPHPAPCCQVTYEALQDILDNAYFTLQGKGPMAAAVPGELFELVNTERLGLLADTVQIQYLNYRAHALMIKYMVWPRAELTEEITQRISMVLNEVCTEHLEWAMNDCAGDVGFRFHLGQEKSNLFDARIWDGGQLDHYRQRMEKRALEGEVMDLYDSFEKCHPHYW